MRYEESDFAKLVRSVSADLNPYTVLFELERTGAIERSSRGLKLCTRIFNPGKELVEGYRILGNDVADLIAAVDQNLTGNSIDKIQTPNLHIKTEYDNIPFEVLPRIREWLLKEGSALHQRARSFLSQYDRDIGTKSNKGKGRARVVVGSFSLIEELAN